MKTIFIKSGSYYENPTKSVAGAIGDLSDFQIGQFMKTDQSFKLDFIDGEYRLYISSHIPGATNIFRSIDLQKIIDTVDKYGFGYYGLVSNSKDVIPVNELFQNMTYIAVNKETRNFINVITGMDINGDNVIPVMFFLKMTDNSYVVYLSSLAQIDSLAHESDDAGDYRTVNDIKTVCSNDGQSIRDHFIDLRFSNVIKHFKNLDLTTGYAVFGKRNETVELDIFKDYYYFDEEFKNSFTLTVDSNFETEVKDGRIFILLPDESITGYLCVRLSSTPLYQNVSSREIKETLDFDFSVSVL